MVMVTKYTNGHVFMLADETQIIDSPFTIPPKNATVIWGVHPGI
jgi:hypothetical protein